MSNNESATHQGLWNTANTVMRRKVMAQNAHIREEEESQLNNQSSHLKSKIKPNQAQERK